MAWVADGEMSAADQQVLYGATAMEASVVVTPSPTPTVKPPTKTLRPGDKDDEVKLLQQRLKDLGYYTGNITGVYNTATIRGRQGVPEKELSGAGRHPGPHYPHGALWRECHLRGAHRDSRFHAYAHHDAPYAGERDRHPRGQHGRGGAQAAGPFAGAGLLHLRLDGVYLTDDIEAVRAFQSANGLKVDGKARLRDPDRPLQRFRHPWQRQQHHRYLRHAGQYPALWQRGQRGDHAAKSPDCPGIPGGQCGRQVRTRYQVRPLSPSRRPTGLSADGVVGTDTSTRLYASNVVSNTVSSTQTLRVGAVSDAVRDMQNRLITLGYLENGEADGKFGVKTSPLR